MTPGPSLIVKPPGCNTPVKIRTINSGNTFGAVRWTDSKCEASMLPDNPWLRKHPGEGVLFWSDECEQIDTDDEFWKPDAKDALWKDLAYSEEPNEQDYFSALDSGIADTPKKLRYLRTRLWWAGNDPIRKSPDRTLSAPHLDNLARLALLLSGDDAQQHLLKAEVFRETGLFQDALTLLESESFGDLQEVATFIASLCHAQNTRVAKFPW